MTGALRVALFVEGTFEVPAPRGGQWLERIWNGLLVDALGCQSFDSIHPMSKLAVAALDPSRPRSSGAAEPLDLYMRRAGAGSAFDAAVIAWDLYPAWDPRQGMCRWRETVDVYRALSTSTVLPPVWTDYAARRSEELTARTAPGDRTSAPLLEIGATLLLCMEPEFEALLACDQAGVRRALHLDSRPKDWPGGWGTPGIHQPGDKLLGPAINRLSRDNPARKRVRGRWHQKKNEWDEYLLRRLLDDSSVRSTVLAQPIALRLAELMHADH